MRKKDFINDINEKFDFHNSFESIVSKIDLDNIQKVKKNNKKFVLISSLSGLTFLLVLSIVLPKYLNNPKSSISHSSNEIINKNNAVGLNEKSIDKEGNSFLVNEVQFNENYIIINGEFKTENFSKFNDSFIYIFKNNIYNNIEEIMIINNFSLKIIKSENYVYQSLEDNIILNGNYDFYFESSKEFNIAEYKDYYLRAYFYVNDMLENINCFEIPISNLL